MPDRPIFSETLTEENFKLFQRNLLTIPAMADIEITNHFPCTKSRNHWLSSAASGLI